MGEKKERRKDKMVFAFCAIFCVESRITLKENICQEKRIGPREYFFFPKFCIEIFYLLDACFNLFSRYFLFFKHIAT